MEASSRIDHARPASLTQPNEAVQPTSPRSPERTRLHASFLDDRAYLPRMVALDKSKRNSRVDAILTLKDSIDKSSSAIQSRNAYVDRQRRARDQADASKFDALLSQGLNPYEVARARNVREGASQERAKIERQIQHQQVTMLQHLEVENVWRKRHERITQEQHAYEKKYQKEMGCTATEARTKQYLVSRTGRETMDPTGKAFRLYPSQVTTIKDRSFGVGKDLVHDAEQRHRLVEKVQRKRVHREAAGAAPSEMLLPRKSERSNNNNHETERGSSPGVVFVAPTAITPGHDLEELNHSILQRETISKTLLPPLVRSSSAEATLTTNPKKGFGKPHRSVLEQRMLDQAREKQKTNIVQKQIVWGKEFTGTAFLADPPEVWFKDFTVGEPMVRTFTLTNVSHTFNHFKLLDLPDAIRELFDISYERPGRMSAGMACRIQVTFTAMGHGVRDIDSAIPALAQTGAFLIPLRCTCQKAVPVMDTRVLEFQNVVAGEKQTLVLKLENAGALPLDFHVRPVKRSVSVEDDRPVPEFDDDGGGGSDDVLNGGQAIEAGPGSEGELMPADEPATEEEVMLISVDGGAEKPATDLDSDEPAINGEESHSPGSLSASTSAVSIQSEAVSAIFSQRLTLTNEEQAIFDHARTATQFKPEGADTPIRYTLSGTVPGYSSSSLAFTFAPACPFNIDKETFLVEFPQSTTTYRSAFWSKQLLGPMAITVTARATQVPIFVAASEVDFRCCLYDRLYRQQLVVCNRGNVALKMQLRVPKALDGCLEFHPNMGFVQAAVKDAAGIFPVQIKFRPRAAMWPRLEAKGWGSAATGFLAVPIQIVVPDQVVPVYVVLFGRMSSSVVSFSHKRLDFGACTLGHSVTHTLTVTNTSRLPQRIAFVKVPPEVRLENPSTSSNSADDGIATLLPQETKELQVVYLPTASATTLTSRLLCRSSVNDEYVIPVTGECLATPLVFSHSVVELAATQLGQRQTYSLSCANNSDKPQTIELAVPAEAKNVLRVTPTVVAIGPRTSIRVEIEFTAREELWELSPSEYASRESADTLVTAPAHSVSVNASRSEPVHIAPTVHAAVRGMPSQPVWMKTNGVPAEERSVHHTWSILCFRQQQPLNSLVAFQVHTSVVECKVFATPAELDFGQVAIGQTLVRELTLTNTSTHDVVLRSRPLHVLGGFRMINSLQRTIPSGHGTRRVKMEFRPLAPLLYDDELELSCPERGVIRVALRGEGVNPSLRIQPEDGVIDFKDVLARSRSTSELQLTNTSGFSVTVAIVPLSSVATTTSSGLPAFSFSPSEATIAAQTTLTVKVLFYPDHQRPQQYYQQFLIQAPSESERHVLSLSGRCWENQLYVYNPHEPPKLLAVPPVEDLFDLPPSVNLSSLLGGSGTSVGPLNSALAIPGITKAPAPLTVVFESETLACETKTVFVGATLPPAIEDEAPPSGKATSSSAGLSFELVIEANPDKPQYAKMFTLEPSKGTLSAAQQQPVSITYQRTVSDAPDATHPELVVSQWIQVRVVCTLRGGALWRPIPSFSAPPSTAAASAPGKGGATASASGSGTGGDSDVRVVQLVLRAKMQT